MDELKIMKWASTDSTSLRQQSVQFCDAYGTVKMPTVGDSRAAIAMKLRRLQLGFVVMEARECCFFRVEVLKDEEQRAMYDQVGHDAYERNASGGGDGPGPGFGGWPGNPFDMENIFHSMFNQGGGGADVKVNLEVSFMEAVQGCTKSVTFLTELPCEACGGTGVPPGTRPETCRRCKGAGSVSLQAGPLRVETTCSQCGGTGKMVKGSPGLWWVPNSRDVLGAQDPSVLVSRCEFEGVTVTLGLQLIDRNFKSLCKSCDGRRIVRGQKTVKLDIVPGIGHNETLKVYRTGGADPDGNRPGDLFVTIQVREDPTFRREGSDIHVDAVLSITQAILGGTIQVPTLTGDVVLKVRPGTQPGQKVVLKRKGIKTRSSFSLGDQYVHFNVSIPANLTQRQRELIEEFAREEQGEYEKGAAAGASG
ncbi:hypothetical protein RJ639_014851 [Escallonia herrerae]|uniref:CR-type domain-containing protein n=1 Tax=Escallonia herrerae TaxID=1293975 RepID=A0AA88VIH3_9ASTE|nr:hypothetical protein RJ639_014851 [Escallonia herrerae]